MLAGLRKIGLDTNAVVYFLHRTPEYYPAVRPIFQRAEQRETELVVSSMVELETLTKPIRDNDVEQEEVAARLFNEFPNLTVLDVTREIAQHAARFRAKSNCTAPDAVIIATAVVSGCEAIVGNDQRLARRVERIPYILLDSFI